jgi:protein AATF/BFR2
MSSSKNKPSISDQISELLKPKQLTEEETAIVDARVEEFNENLNDVISNRLSEIRKQTAKTLNELDDKYKGKAVSRKELELDADENVSDDSSDDDVQKEGGNYATDSDEEMESGDEEEMEDEEEDENSGESEEEGSGSDDDDTDLEEEDFDISQFSKPQHTPTASSTTENKADLIRDVSLNEEIKKGVCVQNQLKVWEKLLEVRIKSQKMLITANGLPDFDAHLELSEDPSFSEKVEKTCDGIHRLMDNLLELQSTLVNK